MIHVFVHCCVLISIVIQQWDIFTALNDDHDLLPYVKKQTKKVENYFSSRFLDPESLSLSLSLPSCLFILFICVLGSGFAPNDDAGTLFSKCKFTFTWTSFLLSLILFCNKCKCTITDDHLLYTFVLCTRFSGDCWTCTWMGSVYSVAVYGQA